MNSPIKRPESIGQAWREMVQMAGEIKRLTAINKQLTDDVSVLSPEVDRLNKRNAELEAEVDELIQELRNHGIMAAAKENDDEQQN